jgi:ribosomal protein S18 acetylase RimI-like enzyme
MSFGRSWPVLRRYLNGLHATYFALFALPTIMARRGTPEQAYIQWLGVDASWQGRKVGRRLVERAIELSQNAHKQELVLHTERSNERARKLYTHSGFEDRSTFSFGPRIRYVKPLV